MSIPRTSKLLPQSASSLPWVHSQEGEKDLRNTSRINEHKVQVELSQIVPKLLGSFFVCFSFLI